MRQNILAITFLTIICNVFGQTNEYRFSPKWKVGDKKTITIANQKTEVKDGELIEDTTVHFESEITVLSESKDDYIIKFVCENIILRAALNYFAKLGDGLPKYEKLELKYSVAKNTGKAELINWEQIQSLVNESVDKIGAFVKRKEPKSVMFVQVIFESTKEAFKSKESIESYMGAEMENLLFPFNKTFVVGDTLKSIESFPNPFKPTEVIKGTTLTYLTSIDPQRKVCEIYTSVIFDLTKFKEDMRAMMKEFMASMPDDKSSNKDKAAKEIAGIDFDKTKLTVITFDYNATWSLKVVRTDKTISSNPSKKSEKVSRTTVTIN